MTQDSMRMFGAKPHFQATKRLNVEKWDVFLNKQLNQKRKDPTSHVRSVKVEVAVLQHCISISFLTVTLFRSLKKGLPRKYAGWVCQSKKRSF